MNPLTSREMDRLNGLISWWANNSFADKVKISKKYIPGLIVTVKDAELKRYPNSDETSLRKEVANAVNTMMAYSAHANGISQTEYELWNRLFPREPENFELFEIRSYTCSGDYGSFCYQVNAHKTDFWTNSFLELTKYMDREDKESIAIFMFMFAAVDGVVGDAERKSIVGFLNRFN